MNRKVYMMIGMASIFLGVIAVLVMMKMRGGMDIIFLNYDGFEVEGSKIVKCQLKEGANLVIPKKINGIEITEIGDYAFNGLDLKSVVIPNSIKKIGKYAFANNKITDLRVPDTVSELGEGAFMHNQIKRLVIGDKTVIGEACFNDNQLSYDEAFFYKTGQDGVKNYEEIVSYGGSLRGNVLIPERHEQVVLKRIGDKAFLDSEIVSVTIPDSVEYIGHSTFAENNLVEVYIPNQVKHIGDMAFSENNYLTNVVVDNSLSHFNNFPWGASDADFYWLKK